ncbi:venom acid phosphatase Acph-1-like [Diachasmimorpha longicaudata]|uniref:venom acid phosphatase Acph-1-like n=1 Tax=Diachasmimorpha longicaudata TaxID=58733 RepID=UPI0030B89025
MPEAPKIFRQSLVVLDKYIQCIVWTVCGIIMSVIICYSMAFLVLSFEEADGLEYKLVSVIFRHGDRTPGTHTCESFPTSPYSESTFYPHGYGQLTNTGKQRAYDLGLRIRARYDDFLGDVYHPHAIMARSSYFDRAKMSLQLVMAAMFPPASIQMWNATFNWQPVVMHQPAGKKDNLISIIKCQNFYAELQNVMKLPKFQEEFQRLEDLPKDLSEWTGTPIKNSIDLCYLYHGLTALQSMGLKLPEWTAGIFPDGIITDAATTLYRILGYTEKIRRLVGGRVLKHFIDTMRSVIKGESKKKMILLSGHELNVSSFLSIFGYLPHIPQYSSAVFVELLAKGDNYYISIHYFLGIPPQTETIKIPGCGTVCPFNKFIDLFSGNMATEEDMMCEDIVSKN